MSVQETMERKLREELDPIHLEVINESSMHAVEPGAETHFRVRIAAAAFEGKTRVAQHQMVYAVLADERARGVHALGIQTMTPAQLGPQIPIVESPDCTGGDGTLPAGSRRAEGDTE